MDSLLQRLNGRSPPHDPYSSSNGSIPITPATDDFASTPSTELDGSIILVEACELQKLKLNYKRPATKSTASTRKCTAIMWPGRPWST